MGDPALAIKLFCIQDFFCCVVPFSVSFSLSLFFKHFSGKSTNLSLSLCQIYCSSSSFFLDSPDVRGVSVESPEFFAGIRVRHSNLTFDLLQRLIWRKDGSFIISVVCICMSGSVIRLIIGRLWLRGTASVSLSEGRWFDFPWSACPSVLGQATEPQAALSKVTGGPDL